MASSPDNRPAAVPPRPGSGAGAEIEPQLDNVLRNLNVNLEDELARYRRHRHGRVPPPPPPRRQRQTLDLISVVGAPATDGAPTSTETEGALPPPPPPPPNPFLNQETSEPETDEDLSEVLLGMDAPAVDSEQLASSENSDESSLPVPASDMPTEGYLESSEELLKSLAEDQTEPASVPEPYSPERKNNGLLKLAGLVLVILAGIGAGFFFSNPKQLQNLRSRILPAPGETADTPTAEEATDIAPPAASPETAAAPETLPDGYKPPGPDLSTREFKELDQIEDLVTLDVDGASGTALPPLSNPAQTPLPTATPTPGQAALPEPATNPGATPAEPATNPGTAPTAAPAAAAPNPAAAPAPAATGSNFYVITSYTGDASLAKARELVPDAFVRNFEAGARIQLAAFDNQAQAAEQVTFLTQQGAVVELFGPTNE